eukprot:scaffold295123_cov16-Tisochrysis_lutea.AAC.2
MGLASVCTSRCWSGSSSSSPALPCWRTQLFPFDATSGLWSSFFLVALLLLEILDKLHIVRHTAHHKTTSGCKCA